MLKGECLLRTTPAFNFTKRQKKGKKINKSAGGGRFLLPKAHDA